MPIWRCPYCGTPQAESARCWVCQRSTTSCATCRHFRRGIAGGLGLCGLDPRHSALVGTELRPCWVARDPILEGALPTRTPDAAVPERPSEGTRSPGRTFVPVGEVEQEAAARHATPAIVSTIPTGAVPVGSSRVGGWSLWGDVEGELPA